MTNEIKLTIRTFEMDTLKEAAKKVQEEAGEAFAEYVILQERKDKSTTRLADEIADTIQASCNLAARYNLNLQAAMERCERRNQERGRYRDAEPSGDCGCDDCDCGGDCGAVPDGVGNLRQKSPEEMSVEELIKALSQVLDFGFSCKKLVTDEWCKANECISCKRNLLDLLKAAHEHEVADKGMEIEHVKKRCAILSESYDKAMVERAQLDNTIDLIRDARDEYMRLRTENGIMLDEILIRQDKLDKLNQQVSDLTHERDGLRNRLAELSDAGITSLHRLLRETVGEAKNVTDNARVYIDKQQGGKDEHCGSRGSDRRNHGGDCGAERVGEHLLSNEPPAQEMSEREKVLKRLRRYIVYMAESPSKNVNRLLACITGNKDARIACKDDIESTRDKLIELLSTPGWDYCKTCELVKSDDGE